MNPFKYSRVACDGHTQEFSNNGVVWTTFPEKPATGLRDEILRAIHAATAEIKYAAANVDQHAAKASEHSHKMAEWEGRLAERKMQLETLNRILASHDDTRTVGTKPITLRNQCSTCVGRIALCDVCAVRQVEGIESLRQHLNHMDKQKEQP